MNLVWALCILFFHLLACKDGEEHPRGNIAAVLALVSPVAHSRELDPAGGSEGEWASQRLSPVVEVALARERASQRLPPVVGVALARERASQRLPPVVGVAKRRTSRQATPSP